MKISFANTEKKIELTNEFFLFCFVFLGSFGRTKEQFDYDNDDDGDFKKIIIICTKKLNCSRSNVCISSFIIQKYN